MCTENINDPDGEDISDASNEEDIRIEDIVALDYLDVVKQEYSHERAKRQSVESRANIVMTIVGVLATFIFDKIPMKDLLNLTHKPLTFNIFMSIISGFGVYFSLGIAIYFIVKCISIEKVGNFPINLVNTDILTEERATGVVKAVLSYVEIIKTHRDVNISKSQNLRNSYISGILILCSMFLYMLF